MYPIMETHCRMVLPGRSKLTCKEMHFLNIKA